VVAILIFSLGAGVSIYKGVHHLIHPVPIQNPYINYAVLAISILFEGAAWLFAFKEFTRVKGKWNYVEAVHRSKDPSIFLVLFEDSAAMIGLGVAFVGIFLSHVTGIPYFDGIAAVIIGLILAGTAIWLAYETKGLLIGESANKEIVRGIRQIASEFESVENVNEILTLHMGPDFILLNLSVDFKDDVPAGDIETIIAELNKSIKETYPRIKRIFVEAEARPTPRAYIH
jgi:cation diffusion facilitator family transporter